MKSLIIIASLSLLAGCATQQSPYYGASNDPYQWRTVSVTNVNLPPDAPRPDNYTTRQVEPAPANSVTYSSAAPAPVYSYSPGTYYSAPVVVAPQPWYAQPQVSVGLGFGVGRHGWLGINQHFGGYPYVVAPYSYWPHRFSHGHRHMYRPYRHHGPRHHGPRHGGRRHR